MLFNGWTPVLASDDHSEARLMRERGDIMALSELINRSGLQSAKIIEAELEHEHGQPVYELELLDDQGRVFKHYYNAVTGERLKASQED